MVIPGRSNVVSDLKQVGLSCFSYLRWFPFYHSHMFRCFTCRDNQNCACFGLQIAANVRAIYEKYYIIFCELYKQFVHLAKICQFRGLNSLHSCNIFIFITSIVIILKLILTVEFLILGCTSMHLCIVWWDFTFSIVPYYTDFPYSTYIYQMAYIL